MKVISVKLALPREMIWKGINVSTVNIGRLNLDGDKQADLSVNGGPEKAVYAYPAER